MTAGGLLLLPVALFFEPALPHLTATNGLGFLQLCLVGTALTYLLWFRGLARIEPAAASTLGFLSPTVAVILGWMILGQGLGILQIAGIVVVLASTWASQRAQAGARPVAHSPLRNTGTREPSGLMPSISIWPEPIIQSIWIRLELPPFSAIWVWVRLAPSM
eukprot:gene50356-68463_t